MQAEVLVIDFGSQYTQLIARRARELGYFSLVSSCLNLKKEGDASWQGVRAVILSGGPQSVLVPGAAGTFDLGCLPEGVPVLGICYGAQLIVQQLGGEIAAATERREYGKATLVGLSPKEGAGKDLDSCLLAKVPLPLQVWMSHGDSIVRLPKGFYGVAKSAGMNYAAFEEETGRWAGLQFHPEVAHTAHGLQVLKNFMERAGCQGGWSTQQVVSEAVSGIKAQVGEKERVLVAVSGGIDSSVTALLLKEALGAKRLRCLFVDNGLLHQGEYQEVLELYRSMGLSVAGVEAADRFYEALSGLIDPEKKRKAIGSTFIRVFEQATEGLDITWLGQGTIYSDRIESLPTVGPSHTIKSHHNVGGLPSKMRFKVIEPIGMLFKDEVREVGRSLHLPEVLLKRHPFPGPGLGIRVVGEVTAARVQCLQQADAIYVESLKKSGLYDEIWQAGAILLPVRSVGVQGDRRTYNEVIALRAVTSSDGMTARAAPLPYDFLEEVATRIANQVSGISRVVYDISSKPPATIEWE